MFRIAFSSVKTYDIESFQKTLKENNLEEKIELIFMPYQLDLTTVDKFISQNIQGVCCFVNDDLTASVLDILYNAGIRFIALRCAGFDMIDLDKCEQLDISVVRVPAYSPYAVAEFAMSTLNTLNRSIHKAYNKIRDFDFTLDGLVGNDIYGKTIGVVGTGKIGEIFINISIGYGCKILAYDVFENSNVKAKPEVTYVSLEELFRKSDFISLHAPLTDNTKHMINEKTLNLMKPSCLLINTSRGKLVDTKALINALMKKKIRGAALDVYENEQSYFFNDMRLEIIDDTVLMQLTNMPNLLLTSHQAFLTEEALSVIALVTLQNCLEYNSGKRLNQLTNIVKKI